jgi:WD40 repeat protein
VWNVRVATAEDQIMRQLQAGTSDVREIAFGADGRLLVAGVLGEGVWLWNLADNSPPEKPPVYHDLSNDSFIFHPDGRLSWIGLSGRSVFDPKSKKSEWTPDKTVTGNSVIIAQHPLADGRLMIYQGVPKKGIGLWEASGRGGKLKRIWFLKGSFDGVAVGLHADRFYLVYESKSEDRSECLQLLRLDNQELLAETTFPGARLFLSAPDGSLVVGSYDSNIYVWRPGDKLLKVRPCGRKHVTNGAFHPSGKYLAITSNDGLVHVLDVSSWTTAKQYAWNLGPLSSIAFSDDGTLAAAGSADGRLVVWDVDL